MVRIKICGICSEGDVRLCSRAGADALGFVTEYPDPVPWNLDMDRARELVRRVPPFVSSVLVTTGSVKKVLSLARAVKPDAVQLHGREDLETAGEIVERLHSDGVKTIKAFPFSAGEDVGRLRSRMLEFQELGVNGVTVDSEGEGRSGGGTGKTVNWERAGKIFESLEVPSILAGGLNPENVRGAIKIADPFGVDVISGVERRPGVKDREKVRKFVERADDGPG